MTSRGNKVYVPNWYLKNFQLPLVDEPNCTDLKKNCLVVQTQIFSTQRCAQLIYYKSPATFDRHMREVCM